METVKNISIQEKAALCYCLIYGLRYGDAYTISHPKSKADEKNMASKKSSWLHKPATQAYIKELEGRAKALRIVSGERIAENGKAETDEMGGESYSPNHIDFTNVESFVAFLNEQANTLTDESQRQKYLAMLSDLLRFKESGKDSLNDIQRFYLPLPCSECVLYKRQQETIK